jgi:hypothetical protein
LPNVQALKSAALSNQAQYDGARLMLAIGVFKRETGKLPDQLADLRQAGLIAGVPKDPFAAAPFQYSAADRALWSVGPQGTVGPKPPADGADFDFEKLHWPLDRLPGG